MRIEAAPHVFRSEDRRQRFAERRADTDRRQDEPRREPRAQHQAHVWFQPAFGAHILGQIVPEGASPTDVVLAYSQPETRTPLRPCLISASA